mgnify:CR=1 FL=1
MQTKKINLKEFKKESLHVKKLLEAKGGSGGCTTQSYSCHTTINGSDSEGRSCDYYPCN